MKKAYMSKDVKPDTCKNFRCIHVASSLNSNPILDPTWNVICLKGRYKCQLSQHFTPIIEKDQAHDIIFDMKNELKSNKSAK